MRKSILYIAFTPDEVHDCAYSILKYLEVYNLNPPADHALVVYTGYPGMLEAYGSFFHSFELRAIPPNATRESLIEKVTRETGAENLLYLNAYTYPVSEIDECFAPGAGTEGSTVSYRNLKEFRILLREFFRRYQEESVPNQVKLVHNLNAKEIERQKDEFERLPFAEKWWRKIIGRGWSISRYSFRV